MITGLAPSPSIFNESLRERFDTFPRFEEKNFPLPPLYALSNHFFLISLSSWREMCEVPLSQVFFSSIPRDLLLKPFSLLSVKAEFLSPATMNFFSPLQFSPGISGKARNVAQFALSFRIKTHLTFVHDLIMSFRWLYFPFLLSPSFLFH